MSNPLPSDEAAPPAMVETRLDHATLISCLRDLSALTRVSSIIAKGPAESPACDSMPVADLPQALALLDTGRVRGLQVRYGWDGADWVDTYEPQADASWRLVRVKLG